MKGLWGGRALVRTKTVDMEGVAMHCFRTAPPMKPVAPVKMIFILS
jgi:hypothetical protein